MKSRLMAWHKEDKTQFIRYQERFDYQETNV